MLDVLSAGHRVTAPPPPTIYIQFVFSILTPPTFFPLYPIFYSPFCLILASPCSILSFILYFYSSHLLHSLSCPLFSILTPPTFSPLSLLYFILHFYPSHLLQNAPTLYSPFDSSHFLPLPFLCSPF
jgi:hypothetical protein